MKNLLPIGLVCLLVSCSKTNDNSTETTDSPIQETKKETCTFGLESYNMIKREPLSEDASRKPRNPGGGNGGGGTTTPPPPPSSAVILLDFDGHVVSGTSWNYAGDIVCSPANMTTAEMAKALDRVTNDYSPFNVVVTLDENVYNAAPSNRRTRVVITETYEWFGAAGGAAFIGSFTSGSNTPCFVFSSLLGYNAKFVGEAASHEAGHTLGLFHQSTYSGCTKIDDYNTGQGAGEIGWAPIMGNAYSQNLSLWHYGPNSNACNAMQDDVSVIANIVGYKTDDYVNSISGAAILSSSLSGVINTSSDADFFSVNLGSAKTISVTPSNVGTGNSGANTDIVLKIYNSQGNLLSTINDASVLNASTYLGAGNYYVSVSTASNYYTSNYGMLGKYTVSLY